MNRLSCYRSYSVLYFLCLLLVGNSISGNVEAKPSLQVKTSVFRAENKNPKGQSLVLPYAFSSESTDFVVGVGGMRKGFYQDQMTVGGLGFAGEDARGAFAGVWDYRLPFSRRTFISASGMYGYYPNHRAYALPREIPVPPGQIRPGSNDSDENVFLESSGESNWLDFKLEYSLPIGATAEKGMVEYQLQRGLLVSDGSGGERWNPLESGATVVGVRQYNRYQSYEGETRDYDGSVHAFEFGLLHDNTDFPINPSRGSSQYAAYHYDPGWDSDGGSWDFLELEASKYFSLGASNWASQRIIALNAWTGYSPSWKETTGAAGGTTIDSGPPFLEGANLGGYYRMRGFRDSRFNDKAAIYGTAEYRYTLDYNPLRNINWLRFLHLDWFQVVGFVEAGRVAPEYSLGTLFEDVKSDAGIGLRALAGGVVVRAEVAVSEEGSNIWVMVGHPF
ncbi:MAG: BamA/TamA family outer membrane protein [Halioglobus sp.]